MAQSFTQEIKTNNEYVTVESQIEGLSFTEGTLYNMQIIRDAYLKIGNAEFYINNEKFDYTASSEDLYIRTSKDGCVLTILEAGN